MNSKPKTCETCGKELFGRKDKRFCDAQCRSTYHNEQNEALNKLYLSTHRILRKNHQILEQLNSEKTTKIRKSTVQKMGFNFDFHTQILQTKSGKTYYYCYNQGWLETGEDWLLLVKKSDSI